MDLIKRFLGYTAVDTQSDENSSTVPSTEKQKDLARLLKAELEGMGLEEVYMDDKGYVYATLPANTEKKVPVIGFISHIDTSPSMSGKDVKPRIVKNYDGGDIVLNKEQNIVLSPSLFPELLDHKGEDIIVTDGTTLLGADDKAGIAEIITAIEYLQKHPEIKHGKVRVGFNPDEEIGMGAVNFDVERFGCEFAYTVDGGEVGEIQFENFNAAKAVFKIQGLEVHPGYAKGKMINASLLAAGFDNIGEKVVQHQARKFGKSKFGLSRFVNGYLDLLSLWFLNRFSKQPMHFFGLWGSIMFVISLIAVIVIGVSKLVALSHNVPARLISDNPYFYIALTGMILGTLMFLAGFVAEMISRSSHNRNDYNIEKELK
jgi:peptidase T